MDIIDILKDYYEREMNNVFCYSSNYLMNSPKRGYEKEFDEARERAEIIRQELLDKGIAI